VTGNATNYENKQGGNPICSTRDEISQPSRAISPRAATSSLLQSTGSSPYVLVHIAGPLAATTAVVAAMWSEFPNVRISLRIFLTIPATVASVEIFFSKLKLVKSYLRSAMSQTRLVDLARLNIESSIARQVDFHSVIRNSANKNTRKSLI